MGLEQGLLEQQASAGLLQANCHPVLQHQATRRFLTEQDDVTVVLMLTGSLLARQRSPPIPTPPSPAPIFAHYRQNRY